MPTPLPLPPLKPRRQKDAEFFAGTDRLLRERLPGQTYSCREIAAACGLSRRAIEFMELNAIKSLSRAIARECPELIEQAIGGDSVTAFFARLTRPANLVGKRYSEKKHCRRFPEVFNKAGKPRMGNASGGQMTQLQLHKEIKKSCPALFAKRDWKSVRDRRLLRNIAKGTASPVAIASAKARGILLATPPVAATNAA